MNDFNEQFIYAVIVIAIGYTLKHFHIIKEKDGEGLSRIIFNITLPTLIIVSFHDMTIEPSLFLLILLGLFYGVFMAVMGLFLFRNEDSKTKGMLTMLVAGFNIGLFAYPLVEGIWGSVGIQYFGMFDVGNALVVFGVIYLIGSHYSADQAELNIGNSLKKLSRSIPLITYLLVCVLAIVGIPIPSPILDVSVIISAANMPLSFLLLGIFLSFSIDRSHIKQMVQVLAIRYGFGLLIGVSLYFIFPLNDMFQFTVLIGFILPISVSVLPYSVEFNYDRRFAGTVSNATILISFFLLWIIANILI